MKKILTLFTLLLLVCSGAWADDISDYATGFEENATTNYDKGECGSIVVSTDAPRTGGYCLSTVYTGGTGNKRWYPKATFAVPQNSYFHIIGYAKLLSSDVTEASNSTQAYADAYVGTSKAGGAVNLTTSWKRVYSTSGKASSNKTGAQARFYRKHASKLAVLFDDVIAYVSTNSEIDLTAPTSATSASATVSAISWTVGNDANTGIQKTLIFKRTSGSADDLTLNDQGIYSLTPTEGPSTDQSGHWTLVAVVNGDATSYEAALDGSTRYAIVHRDLAYNYSTPTYVTTPSTVTYKVTYKANNGTEEADVVENVATVGECPNTFSAPSGKIFAGWNTQADGKGTDYAVGDAVTGNLELFAQWLTDNDATFGNGAYIIESSALDLSTLFTSSSDGAVTYTVTDANGTGASIEGTSFTATTAGTATVKASQSATSTYTAKELTATITVATNPLGSHTLTWSIATNTSTLSSTQNSSSLVMPTSNMTEIALKELTIDSGEKQGLSAKIQALASYDAAKYAYISFTVADGYRFTPSSVTAVVQAVGTGKDQNCKMILSDTKNSIESDVTECPGTKDGSPTDVTISNDGNVSFTGTVTLKIYVYGNAASYRLGPAITISGNVFKVDNVTIAANKEWITYCSTNALDFSKEIEGLESAYTISSHTSGATTLTATPMTGAVKSGTGLLLHAKTVDPTNPQVISIPVVASGDEQTENMLKGVIVDTEITPTDGIYTNLGLKNGTFVPYSAAGTIAANKAYLQIPTSDMPTAGAKLTIVFGEKPSSETDGIKAVSTSVENGVRYNLAGQKVGADYKGIVIVNGKKVIIK